MNEIKSANANKVAAAESLKARVSVRLVLIIVIASG